jgi:hypothetical protein
MALIMKHEKFGERPIDERQLESYLGTGWTQVDETAPESVGGTIASVLAYVGDDAGRAGEALTAEHARTTPRTSLVTSLKQVIDNAAAAQAGALNTEA